MDKPVAALVEVFSSFQGEGLLVGVRQAFVRFHGCNLKCAYCDTPQGRGAPPATWTLNESADASAVDLRPNPASVADLTAAIERFDPGHHHSIALTGGGPLLQAEFLQSWLPAVKQAGWQVYLETNGTLPGALGDVLPWVDWVAADIKIDVDGLRVEEGCARRFLALIREKHSFVKVIFGAGWSREAIGDAARLCAEAEVPLVLQPATAVPGGPATPTSTEIYAAHEAAVRYLRDVRVIPQTHKALGLR